MATPRALIEMVVDGAAESRRRVESVTDVLRQMNGQSLQNISNQMNSLNDRFSGLQSTIGNVTSFAIAGVSLATLGTKVVGVLDSMGELDDLSQKIGTSVESLSRIQRVAKTFGVDFAGAVDPAMVKLADNLAGVDDKSSRTAKALAAIGVSAKDSAGKLRDPGKVMIDVAKSLQNYEDSAGKAAVVNDIFGKSGAKLLPFLNDLAEHVDSFTGVSADAVKQATGLQDSFGMLSERTDEAFTSIVTAALPAMSGLVEGFTDVLKADNDLMKNGEIAEWASMAAMGVARVADVAVLAVRGFSALASSVEVITADLEVLWTASPANMGITLAKGGSPLADLKKVVAERNQVLEAANAKWAAFYNADGNMFEQAVKNKLSSKVSDVKPSAEEDPKNKGKDKGDLNGYKPGSDTEEKDADKKARAYQNLVKAIQSKIVQTKLELNAGGALTASQQEHLRMNEQLAAIQQDLTPVQRLHIESLIQEEVATLEVIESNKRAAEGLESYNKVMAAYEANVAKAIESASTEADRNQELALVFGKTKSEIESLELARLKEQLAQRASTGMTLTEIENLEKLIAAKERNATALAKIDALDAGKKAAAELAEFLDPARAQSFGEALRESFGSAGSALSALVGSLDGYSQRQAEIEKQRKNASAEYAVGLSSEMQHMQALGRLDKMEAKNRLSSYGDMAGAAAGFFGEQSRGYKTLSKVSQVFHAAEIAMSMGALAKKMLAKETEVIANTALNATKLSGEAATTAASTGLAATEASAWGITAVVKAIASLPFPLNLAAGAATLAAVVSVGASMFGSVGGSVSLSESRQKTQGAGTVLGSDEQSESISNSLELIESATSKGLNISTGMLTALRNIEANIGQFASFLVQSTGVSGEFGSSFATKDGNFFSKLGSSIFGGKKTVEDTGFMLKSASLSSILSGGANASQYADIKKSGGWFSSSKMSTQVEGLGAEGNRQITSVLTSLYSSVVEAGKLLGVGGDDFTNRLSGFVVDIGKVSLKGLSGAEIEEQLSAVFSKVGDQLASFGIAGIAQFQQIGEGALETLTRVAANYASLDAVLGSVGKTFGATGLASIAAREDMLTLAGGIDELSSKTSSFAENFLTEAERLAPVRKYVTEQMATMGLADLRSRESFKKYVQGLDLTNAAQRAQFVALMDLQEAYAQLYPEIEDATMTVADAKSALVDAYNAESDAIGATIDRMTSFASSLRSLRENALLGGLSPLSPQQKYAEAKAQYESVLAAARGGDESAQSNYSAAFNSFLTASRAVFASSAQYQADFAYAQASTAETERWASAQVDVGKAQLDALKLSVSGLVTLDKSVLSVRDAILQMHQVMGTTAPVTPTGIAAPPQVYMPTPVMYSSYGTDSSVALVKEIKRLNVLVEKLTADQNAQTGDIIKANAIAARESADAISKANTTAVKAVATNQSWEPYE